MSSPLWQRLAQFLERPFALVIAGASLVLSLLFWFISFEPIFDPAWLAVLICGYPLLYLALSRLIYKRWISSALLIVIAMFACLAIGELFAAGEVAFIMALGALLEEWTVKRAQRGLKELIDLVPQQAHLANEEKSIIEVSQIEPGTELYIFPGERVAVDAVVIEGQSCLDQSVMTGESLPQEKTVGDELYSGSINQQALLKVRALRRAKDSSLEMLIRLMKEIDENKAPMQRLIDKWAMYLVPIALGIAACAFLICLYLGMPLLDSLTRAITVLVVFCPCALALATPVSVIAAIGNASKRSIIIKSAEALEALASTVEILFDKTGTLSTGELELCDCISFVDEQNFSQNYKGLSIYDLIYELESCSDHPLAQAIAASKKLQERRSATQLALLNYESIAGRGIKAVLSIEGQKEQHIACAGNQALLEQEGIRLSDSQIFELRKLQNQGKASVLFALDNQVFALLSLSDKSRPESPDLIAQLKAEGFSLKLVSGDSSAAVRHFSESLGIEDYYAECRPQDKLALVQRLQQEGKKLCMLGDGINDSLALSAADVSIAPGTKASAVASNAASICFMQDALTDLLYVIKLAKSCFWTIQFNIVLSMCINVVAIVLSVMGLLSPVTGALVHNVGSVLVGLNASRLYSFKMKD